MGQENLEKLLPYIDCIKGHNSQLRWKVPSFLPMLGNFRKYLNNLAQQFAEEHNKPWIANSDGHRIEDVGISYIDINSDSVKIDSEKRFLSSLRLAILCNEFSQHCSYENQFTWLNWVSKLIIGIKSGKDKK